MMLDDTGYVLHSALFRPGQSTVTKQHKFGTGASWEDNRIGLASHWHASQTIVVYYHLRAHGLRKGDDHLANTPVGARHTLFFYHYMFRRLAGPL